MASGKQHNIINFSTLGAMVAVNGALAAINLPHADMALAFYFVLAFAFGTLFLSPDLDMADEKMVNSKRNWGILGPLWVPYGLVFKHRGISHSWFVGPLTRLLYLALMVLGPWALIWFAWPHVAEHFSPVFGRDVVVPHPLFWIELWPWWPWWPVLAPLLAGYWLSQWVHNVTDVMYSAAKNHQGKAASTPLGALGKQVVQVSNGEMSLKGTSKKRSKRSS